LLYTKTRIIYLVIYYYEEVILRATNAYCVG
jgi:hypothetical protein